MGKVRRHYIQSFKLRLKVYMRDGFTCAYCKKAMNPLDDDLTLDHIEPDSPDTEENLVTACAACNSVKNKCLPEEFLRQLAMRRGAALSVEMQVTEVAKNSFGIALRLEELVDKVCAERQIPRAILIGKRRTNERKAVETRAEIAILARRMGHTLPSIGRVLEMHHTSIMHLINRYSERLTLPPTGISQGQS